MKLIKGLILLLICNVTSAGNYYEVVYSTIRNDISIFQVENFHTETISCAAMGQNFYEEFRVYPQSSSIWYITPQDLSVDCHL